MQCIGHEGFSESLIRINEQWYPVQVAAMPREAQVVDFDPREDDVTELPGLDRVRDDPVVRSIQNDLREGVREPLRPDGEPPVKNDDFKEQWDALSPMQIRKMDVLNGPELLDVLRAIAAGADPDQAIDSKVVQKLSPLFDSSTIPTNGHQKQQVREN